MARVYDMLNDTTNSHKYYQKMKVNRISKMQAGRKKSETLSLINTIAQLEGVN